MTNTLISIGFMGGQTCYLNVSIPEAQRRYKIENDHCDDDEIEGMTRVLHFSDQFDVYDLDDAKRIEP